MFLLDTDHIGIIQRRSSPQFDQLWQRMALHSPEDFYISIVSFHEQVLGWNAYLNRARDSVGVTRAYQMFQRVLADFATSQVAQFDSVAAGVFDALRKQSIRIATMDLRIAAIAIARDFTLLTRNLADFRRVPGLRVEDWTT
jgi:tRNA(fMet)-specific endonuclease VapC